MEVQKFIHPQFGEIRTCIEKGKIMFCLSDACKALDMTNPRMVKQRLAEGGATWRSC